MGNISTPTLYELINSGTLKTYKIGTRRYTTHAYIAECIRTLTERTMSGGKKRGTA
ncbi:DNA-binding protein [Methylocaldum sp. BRCS4]|nr:DNA-binding protein [Methylocaldum sp. BRCS4]